MEKMQRFRVALYSIRGTLTECSAAKWWPCSVVFLLSVGMYLSSIQGVAAEDSASQFIEFDDQPLQEDIILPDWFKLSFLELKNDLDDLSGTTKKGLLLYFGQRDCPYCKAHLEKNWGDRGIVNYTQQHFEVIAIDVVGQRPVADVRGKVYKTEKQFSAQLKANFTPSLLFFDRRGKEVFRLSGYHPPYQFRAALEFVADKHYQREDFRHYLARGDTPAGFEESELNTNAVFAGPPYALQRTQVPAKTHLVVFFEEPTCHACNVLHAGPLRDRNILGQLNRMEVVQLDLRADTPVLTPDGKRTTAKLWAETLGLYYAPTIVFFEQNGKEVLRIDSVVHFYRLNNVLRYILSESYREYPSFQLWRQKMKL